MGHTPRVVRTAVRPLLDSIFAFPVNTGCLQRIRVTDCIHDDTFP